MTNLRIKNFEKLASSRYRRDVLSIVEAGYGAIDTEKLIKDNIKLDKEILVIKGQILNIQDFEHIYVLGFGKVACKAASAVENILKTNIKSGAVIGVSDGVCEIIETYKGTHPLPSETNFRATERIREIGDKATERDLVIVIVGGGGSALLCSSRDECDQGEKLYEDFLSSGGNIKELNTVRKHISELKGGGLAKVLYPATVISLIFSDVPEDECDSVASGPTYKDETTIDDAKRIMEKYSLNSLDLVETPKEDKFFEKVHNIILVSNHTALEAMKKKAKEQGYGTEEAGCDLYLTAEETLEKMINLAKENNVVVAGGEARLIVPEGCTGKGGRNDYLAMEMLERLRDNQVFVSFSSDGLDNTESAGAIVDKSTNDKIKELGIKIDDHKVCLDSFTLFEKTGDLIMTGPIESNVSDLMILLTYVKD